jgi:hypothetical protein
MATLIKVDGSEIEIHPSHADKGLLPSEMFCLVGQTLKLICLDKQSVMIVNNDLTTPALKNYRATKVLQFFTDDDQDEVRSSALLVGQAEIHVENWTMAPLGDGSGRLLLPIKGQIQWKVR